MNTIRMTWVVGIMPALEEISASYMTGSVRGGTRESIANSYCLGDKRLGAVIFSRDSDSNFV